VPSQRSKSNYLFADDMPLYLEKKKITLNIPPKLLLELMHQFSEITRYKISTERVAFL
jgi:hypothetical protein